jgi:hypothetical protein
MTLRSVVLVLENDGSEKKTQDPKPKLPTARSLAKQFKAEIQERRDRKKNAHK